MHDNTYIQMVSQDFSRSRKSEPFISGTFVRLNVFDYKRAEQSDHKERKFIFDMANIIHYFQYGNFKFKQNWSYSTNKTMSLVATVLNRTCLIEQLYRHCSGTEIYLKKINFISSEEEEKRSNWDSTELRQVVCSRFVRI